MNLRPLFPVTLYTLLLVCCTGCGSSDAPQQPVEQVTVDLGGGGVDLGAGESLEMEASKTSPAETKKKPVRRFQPITLGGGASPAGSKAEIPEEQKFDSVLEALKPLQVMLGDWRGITYKKTDGFSSVETLDWVWDLQTNPQQPALVMKADKSRYHENARLTYLTDKQKYQLTITGKEGDKRIYEGDFTVPVAKVEGDADPNILQTTYKLSLSLVDPGDERKNVQITFNQQNNDRYLYEIYNLRGDSVTLADTITTRRNGTSFAKSDSDYGTKTCVISGGLGTSQVNYQGKSYWVCCSGCRKAFDADPEKWIAKYEANKKKTANQ